MRTNLFYAILLNDLDSLGRKRVTIHNEVQTVSNVWLDCTNESEFS